MTQRRVFVGADEAIIDGNLIEIHAQGDLTQEHAEQGVKIFQELYAQHRDYFVLVDLNDAGSVSPRTRRYLAEAMRPTPPFALAVYGLASLKRAMAALIIGAVNLFRGQSLNMGSFKTELEARAWLETQWQGRRIT